MTKIDAGLFDMQNNLKYFYTIRIFAILLELNYVIIKVYKELQDRVRVVCKENTRGNKSERIERTIGGKNELYILWKK